MAESGVLYTCSDDFLARVPSVLARAGIASKEMPRPVFGEGCEKSFALKLSRDKRTVELSGFYFLEERRFVIGLGCGRNPLRWYWDIKLSAAVKELLLSEGMTSLSTQTSTRPSARTDQVD
jgi:hypothetical protein